ncbi:transcription elongation factor GreB [Methylotenera sp.]|uniref:transcription elongation factor GreB n=1 Tax=Methylotenera sp. TaxID=2051956 RepID=UPI0027345B8A|nr:transcription elongation factor GreB [Methylotenera sp.]MDP3210676.1 transcription elongation factor GreB [Methylotenera sp.]
MNEEKNYITPEGHAAIEAEFQELLKVERPALVKVVSWAAGNGDRSENGDYIYGKRRLRQIDSRLRFLMQRMDLAVIVDPATQLGLDKVFFGAWVTLYSLKNESEHTYRIVGKDELEPSLGYISWVSPLARAMLGKQIGDVVKVTTPVGEEQYEIIEVQYQSPNIPLSNSPTSNTQVI